MALAQWIQDAKARALASREGMRVVRLGDCPPYKVAQFGCSVFSPSVGWGDVTGGGAYWIDDDECARANAELLAHAREDILRLVAEVEALNREVSALQKCFLQLSSLRAEGHDDA